jgi:hypothetical protein
MEALDLLDLLWFDLVKLEKRLAYDRKLSDAVSDILVEDAFRSFESFDKRKTMLFAIEDWVKNELWRPPPDWQPTPSLSWSDFIQRVLTLIILVWQRLYEEIVFRCSYSEFPQCRRPPCTTMPWSIWPSLMVLWGVCWMFPASHTPQGTLWGHPEFVLDPLLGLDAYTDAAYNPERGQLNLERGSPLDGLFGLDLRKCLQLLYMLNLS